MKKTFYTNGHLEFGPGNFIQFTNEEIHASSPKQAKLLLATKLKATRFRHLERSEIYRALNKVHFSTHKYESPVFPKI